MVTIAEGEYSSKADKSYTIKGRLESSQPKRFRTDTGDHIESTNRFFTTVRKIANASSLTVNEKSYRIISWVEFQNYCEIWLD